MGPVRPQAQISSSTLTPQSLPDIVTDGMFNSNMAVEENVGTINNVRGDGEGATAVAKTILTDGGNSTDCGGSTLSGCSSWVVDYSSGSSLPTPLKVKPGVAAETALQVLRTYARRLRVTENNETEAEE